HNLDAVVNACNTYDCTQVTSNNSAIHESALGLRPQYTTTASTAVDDQESLQVNVADGNLVLQATDFSLPGIAGFGYSYARTYNSLNNTGLSRISDLSTLSNPTLAVGWSDLPDLAFFANGDARYSGDGGYEITFTWNSSSSTFTAPPGADAKLVATPGGYNTLTFDQTGVQDVFYQGRLDTEYDRNGNAIHFMYTTYPTATVLSQVTDTTGRVTTFNYNASLQMTSVTAPCSYANLSGTTSTSGGTLATGTYYYEVSAIVGGTESTVASEISEAVTGPTGSVALAWHAVPGATSYRVYRGTSSGGENTYYTTTNTSYTDTGSTGTSGTPPALSGTCTYAYGYNGSGELSSYTDPLGATTNYGYNGAGLLSTIVNPLGNDANNRLLSETNGLQYDSGTYDCLAGKTCPTTSYGYFANGDVKTTTDPNGNVTTDCYNGDHEVTSEFSPLAAGRGCGLDVASMPHRDRCAGDSPADGWWLRLRWRGTRRARSPTPLAVTP
ncbi:MAG TPA: DUF6531 domain-containing protein, partial [Fimbriimonadaceae bacterium]|nr:DUF6531 domain-containing protein [Fimbriimonadaceae bacterium]